MPSFAVQRDQATAEFFDGTARGEFVLVQDTRTGEVLGPQFVPAVDPERYVRVAAAGTGTVVSWVVVHERAAEGGNNRPRRGAVRVARGPRGGGALPGA